MTMQLIRSSLHVPPKRWQSALVIGLSDIEGVDGADWPYGALPGEGGCVSVPLTSLPFGPPFVPPPVVSLPVAPLPVV